MKKNGSILIIDDNSGVLTAVRLLLKPYFDSITTLNSPSTLLSTIGKESPSIVLLDMNFSSGINTGNEGLFWLNEIKMKCPLLPVVLFTAYADIDLAVKGIKQGATDFIVKPWDNQRLIDTLLNAVSLSKQKQVTPKSASHKSTMYWGDSAAMQQLHALVEKVAATDANILITGENGTGKEMLAHEIHALSSRRNQEMISVDMGAVTESLFESELFGHVKGAFTDAHADRAGKFEIANHSTLFLDEIGNLPYHLQAKLLTVLQRRNIIRVGSNLQIPIDIRLVCATNKDLNKMVGCHEFREDLLYRINTIHLEMPPLRKRIEDIAPLTQLFITYFCHQYNKPTFKLSSEAQKKLESHSWQGNIRELEHAIEKAVIICESEEIPAELFQLSKPNDSIGYLADSTDKSSSTLEDMERKMIQQTLRQCEGNLSATASQLGITRQTLYNKMKKFEL